MAIQNIQVTNDVTFNRSLYIGGSDIAAVLGKSRYKTPYRLWCEKTGRIESTVSNLEAVNFGTELEEFVAQTFSKRANKPVRKAPKGYQHPDYPYMVAHVDRLITGSDELLECKTCSAYKLDEWQNAIPKEYILQVIWYLGITGRKRGWIACLIGGQKFDYKYIDFDEELFNLMVEKAKEFYNMVQTDTPPLIMPDDDETLGQIYSVHTDDLIEAQEFDDRIAYLQELKMHRDDMNAEIKEIETELKAKIGENLGISTDKYKVTWKTQTTSRLDTDKLREEIAEIDNFYIKKSYRVLRITKNKEKEQENV